MERSIDGTQVAEPIAACDVHGGDELRLHVREWGNAHGPPIIFVHGWSQCQLCWSRQVAGTLAEGFRIVTFDLRGHGMSERPLSAEHYTDSRLWADDLAAVIAHVGPERPLLVASSYGGYVVTDYLRVYGDAGIAGINLAGGAVMLKPTFDNIGPGLLENAGGACSPDLATNIAAVCRLLRAFTVKPMSADDWSTAVGWTMVVPIEVRQALFAREIDADGALSALSVPLLVTHGRHDAIVLPSMAEHVLEVCETAEISWYEDVGHLPFFEDPDRFDRELHAFADRAVLSRPLAR